MKYNRHINISRISNSDERDQFIQAVVNITLSGLRPGYSAIKLVIAVAKDEMTAEEAIKKLIDFYN